jgi:hypothetical protein
MKIALSIAAIAAVSVEGKASVRGSRNLEVCGAQLR